MECCIHQGEHFPPETIEVHHIHPQAYGGDDAPTNRANLCVGCHTITHQAALRLYAGKAGEARDMVDRYLPNQPARQERLWRLVQAVAKARMGHARSSEIPEAGVDDPDHLSTVKMSLDLPDWLHHRLKSLATGQGLYRYVMKVLENHAAVATQKPGAPPKELFGAGHDRAPSRDPQPTSLKLLDPTKLR